MPSTFLIVNRERANERMTDIFYCKGVVLLHLLRGGRECFENIGESNYMEFVQMMISFCVSFDA